MFGQTDHPQRYMLINELHARPSEPCQAPERITQYAVLRGEGDTAEDCAHVAELCDRMGVAPPPTGASHFTVNLDQTRLKWERHTEFTTYTFFRQMPSDGLFNKTADEDIPQDWKDATPGELIAAIQVVLQSESCPVPTTDDLNGLFAPDSLATSLISDGAGQVWTDFRLHGDGFSRILLHNFSMSKRRVGRAVQRLLEIETYRLMTLLGLPMAQEAGPRLSKIDASLAHLTLSMNGLNDMESEASLLRRLTRVSTDIETLATLTAFRFGATRAYHALVETRVSELREERIEGYQTMQEFIDRRLAPAARTCNSVSNRIGDLSRRATRAANLLRTRVDIALQAQNQLLLSSMEKRTRLQLRLQQTVEGLSVAAISYYAVGLIGYVIKGGEAFLPGLSSTLSLAIATPAVIVTFWILIKRFHKKVEDAERYNEG